MTSTRPPIDDPLNAFCTDTEAFLAGAANGPLAGLRFAARTSLTWPDTSRRRQPRLESDSLNRHTHRPGRAGPGRRRGDSGGQAPHRRTHPRPFWRKRSLRHAAQPARPGPGTRRLVERLGRRRGGQTGRLCAGFRHRRSVRIPASFCGLYGLRPTHGCISLDGVLMQASSYDTVGFFARDAELFARVGQVFLQNPIPPTRPCHLVVVEDAFELADASVAAALQPWVERITSLVASHSAQRLAPAGLQE